MPGQIPRKNVITDQPLPLYLHVFQELRNWHHAYCSVIRRRRYATIRCFVKLNIREKGWVLGWDFSFGDQRCSANPPPLFLADFLGESFPYFSRSVRVFPNKPHPDLHVFYICMNTFNTAVKKLLTWARYAGCEIILFGFEKLLLTGIWPSGSIHDNLCC